MRLVLGQGKLDGTQIVGADALAQALQPAILKRPPTTPGGYSSFYGLGFNVDTEPSGLVRWSHSGAFSNGAATDATLVPGLDLGIVVSANGAPIGVPEAMVDAYLELLEKGSITQDWVQVWGQRLSGAFGTPLDLSSPPADAPPARADQAYVGTYSNPYVGDVQIVAQADGSLAIVEGPGGHSTYPLTHSAGNEFSYVHDPEAPDFKSSVTFTVGPDGVATAVADSTFDQGRLRDAPAELTHRQPDHVG